MGARLLDAYLRISHSDDRRSRGRPPSGDGSYSYSECGKQGEPSVIWVDVESGEDDEPYVAGLAPDSATFLAQLRVPPQK